ncbi:MAG: NAD(P)/FAD-dependent oxidoreductase [Tissierellia bacterium]|nr:NAD(P)/FAD-dependent oxidoreductase [Tissierellia bacterium]
MYDSIIIGAGAAGCAAAIYTKSRDLNILILEQEKIGGLIGNVSTVTHYPGIVDYEKGSDFVKRIDEQLKNAEIELNIEKVIKTELKGDVKKVYTKDNCYEAKSVIICSGTVQNKLNVPGEEEFSNDFVSHRVLEDGDKFKNKTVIIVGGSDGAMKEAIYMAKIAKKTYVLHHGEKITAIGDFQRKAKDLGVEYILDSEIAAFEKSGDENIVKIKNLKSGEVTEMKEKDLGVFIYAGSTPETEIYSELELENGYIVVDKNMQTSIEGVFAAGDIIAKDVRQVSTAAAEGTVAALKCNAFLKK